MAEKEHDSKHWLGRAAEARATAEEMRDPVEKSIMLEIAQSYDRIAAHVARSEGSSKNGL